MFLPTIAFLPAIVCEECATDVPVSSRLATFRVMSGCKGGCGCVYERRHLCDLHARRYLSTPPSPRRRGHRSVAARVGFPAFYSDYRTLAERRAQP
jgi:hypothetical protein